MAATTPIKVGEGLLTALVALNAVTAVKVFSKDMSPIGDIGYTSFREILNVDAAIDIFIGPVGVTSATGYKLKAGASWTTGGPGTIYFGDIYAIAASGTPNVNTIQY